MPTCPRCHQFVKAQAVICPTCQLTLKAHGHPGMTLHRSAGEEYLCDSCLYHEDDTCNFPQRPFAKECTLYYNQAEQAEKAKQYKPSPQSALRFWLRRNTGWIILAMLILVSLAIAVGR
ncbi:zinc ribbon domain-containing protein [Egbenema bharatensis]|uniref:zinc ribbon domain-containing protein n=1 Tax=Egbenema bharatensis TaxID=3463334 RepID=UPI003A8963B9